MLCRSNHCPINLSSSSLSLLSSTSTSFDDNDIIIESASNMIDDQLSPLANDDHYSLTTSDILSLESIRSTLVRQGKLYDYDENYLSLIYLYVNVEETIIFALIERAQYRRNYDIYDAKTTKLRNIYGAPLSFLEWMLLGEYNHHSYYL